MGKLYGWVLVFINPLSAIAAAFVIHDKAWAWCVTLGLLALFSMLIGLVIDDNPLGIIIDSRNCYSLSKFQLLGWTLLVLSAWIVFVATRVQLGQGIAAANVDLPGELLALLGISTTSLVAAPALLSLKKNQPSVVDPATLQEGGVAQGSLYVRTDRSQARFIDIFRGDDVTNYNIPDISKLQQVLVTLVVLIVYAVAIWQCLPGRLAGLTDPKAVAAALQATATLPPLSEKLVWLVGISHGGYLAYKAAPHSAGPASAATGDGGPV